MADETSAYLLGNALALIDPASEKKKSNSLFTTILRKLPNLLGHSKIGL